MHTIERRYPLHAISYSAVAPSSQFWRGGSARCPGSWSGCGLCSIRLLSLGGGGPSLIFPARDCAMVRLSFRAPWGLNFELVIGRRAARRGQEDVESLACVIKGRRVRSDFGRHLLI